MNTMTYNGYEARIEYDETSDLLVGRLVGIDDMISFHAESVKELHSALKEAVEDYLDTCARIGKAPERPRAEPIQV
ncbi:MAG: type II toxin-antitoxin system HicB family antitoxin [Methylohalobius sp. ZOD2]